MIRAFLFLGLLHFFSAQAPAWAFFPVSESSQALFASLKGNETEIAKFLKSQIENTNIYNSRNTTYRMTTVPKVDGGPLAEWVPILDPETSKLIVELRITEEGLKSPLVMAEEVLRLNQISTAFNHPYVWAETVLNAKAGSIRATEKLARMDYENAISLKDWFGPNMVFFQEGIDPAKIEEWTRLRLGDAKKRYDPIAKAAKAETKRLQAEWDRMRPKFDELERQEKKLNDFVMANDRKGARNLIEKYLPWPLMEPSEKSTWMQWLDAMENPDPSRRQLVFRGMDGYPVLKTPGSEKVGMFSTVLAMNQGNYTRRLRSLTTAREARGVSTLDNGIGIKFPKDQPSLIVQMANHAADPQASPFISVTDDITASRFGVEEKMALLVDERRLIYNALAFNYGEKERLIPLVVFPEEVVFYQPKEKGRAALHPGRFIEKVTAVLGRPVTPAEINMPLTEEEFTKKGFSYLGTSVLRTEERPVSGLGCVVGVPCDCIRNGLTKLLNE